MLNFKSDLNKVNCNKLTPMFLLFCLISFVYNLSRPLKISLAIGAKESGAEIIPFLKLWGILPCAFIFTCLFIVLSNKTSRENVFYIFIGIFISFFALFKYYLYPNLDNLVLTEFSLYLKGILPLGAKGFIEAIYYWPISLFYILAELWGTIILYTLFWGFANEVTKLNNAKKVYALFAFSSNLSVAIAGYIGITLSNSNYTWEYTFSTLLNTILVTGILIAIVFKYMHITNKIDINEAVKTQEKTITKLKSKKMSLSESLKSIFQSKYLLYIAIIVISYNIATNLGETLWTAKMKELYHEDKSKIASYIYYVTMYMGLIAMPVDLFVTRYTLKNRGWTFTALITPIVFLLTGLLFYFSVISSYFELTTTEMNILGLPLSNAIILLGAFHICITRAARASVMDASKEMAYIPLDLEEKRKGKAVIDSISSRLGKAGGSTIYQVLLISFGTMAATTPYIVGIIVLLSFAWIYAVKEIGIKVEQHLK